MWFDKKKLGRLVDWCLAFMLGMYGLYALWLLLQVTTFASFKIPTSSMEPTLQPGDCVLVNKWIIGPRIFDIWDAASGKEVDIYRLPGVRHIRRNDVLVFHDPYPMRRDSISMNVLRYYIKRCIALPGDTLEIIGGINKVRNVSEPVGNLRAQEMLSHVFMPHEGWKKSGVFPQDSLLGWTLLEFGPMYVPVRHAEISMTTRNLKLYKHLIEWEQKKKLTQQEGEFLLGDSIITNYRFKENYYFMAGDYALNSRDSRYWGVVPESYIVGVATRIWKSINPDSQDIRWDRVGKKIE